MAMPSFAFSVHNFISSTGADAGFAALVGLAILVLLYFAHARETANLREEAELLTQRLQHAEARVAQLMRMQPPPSAAEVPASSSAVQLAPFAPAGTAAPALASATRLVPVPLEVPEPEQPIVVQRPAPAPVPAMALAGVAAAPAAPPSPPEDPAPVVPPAPPRSPGAIPAPATNAGGNGAGHEPDRDRRPPVATRASVPRRSLPPLDLPPPRGRRSRVGRGIVMALVALAAVAIAVVLFAVTSLGGASPHSSGPRASNAPTAGARAFKPSSVTVAVLNGTAVNQLAHRIALRLAGRGYKEGTIATAANQTESKTIVAYRPGSGNRTGALHVARALGLRPSAVQPIDQSTLQVACPGPSTCTANVVVTVGADLATS